LCRLEGYVSMFLKEMKIVDQSVIFTNGLVVRKMVVRYSFLAWIFCWCFCRQENSSVELPMELKSPTKNSSTTNFHWRVYQ